ncbi:hypothetical protein D3C86_1431180 [compost metagenome]
MKTHFMLGRMHVDIDLMRIDFKIKHKRGLLIGTQFVFTGLANGVIYQAIAHHAAIHITILNLSQRRVHRFRIGNPAAHR